MILRHALALGLLVLLLLALPVASFSQEASADRATELLEKGIAEFRSLQFGQAQATLLRVQRDLGASLIDTQKKQLALYLAKVPEALRRQADAQAAYTAAEEALNRGDLQEAEKGFAKAADSEFLPLPLRRDAMARLRIVREKMRVASAQPAPVPVAAADPIPTVRPVAVADPVPVAAPTPTPATQPADTVAAPAAKPAAETQPTNQVEDLLARVAVRRKAEALELIAAGKKALANNEPEKAITYFEQALLKAPDDEEALKQLNYARNLVTPSGSEGLLSRVLRNRRIAKQISQVEFDKAMKRARGLLTEADSKADFQTATEAANVAATVLEANRSRFSTTEYREMQITVKKLLDLIALRGDEWGRQQVRKRASDMERAEADRLRVLNAERERKVAVLIERAKTLQAQHKFSEALEQVDRILHLDPTNEYGTNTRDLLEQFVLFQMEKGFQRERTRQTQLQWVNLREAEIPWYQHLTYPTNWKELTARRERYAAGDAAESPADAEIRQRLKQVVPKLDFDNIEFNDVVQFLRDVSGANIYVNWSALQAAGIDKTSAVNVHLRNVMLEKALRLILADVSAALPEDARLGYVVDEGVLAVSTRSDLARNPKVRVYDIRDLLIQIRDFERSGDDDDTTTDDDDDLFGGGGDDDDDNDNDNEDGELTQEELATNLIDLIKETIDPNSWRPTGEVGAIRHYNGQLIVTQTPENHMAVLDLLNQLREARALQVSVEAKFITLSTGFINSIGLDLDFYFNVASRLGTSTRTDPWTQAEVPIKVGPSGWRDEGRQYSTDLITPLPVSIATFGASQPLGSSLSSFHPALAVSGTFLDDFQANFIIQATQAHKESRTMIAPRLTLSNGQMANFSVGKEIAYVSGLTPVVSDNGLPGYRPTVSTRTQGTQMEVRATVSADRRYVTLQMRPQVAGLATFERIQVGENETLMLPTQDQTEIETTVTVPDGGTVLLGGQRFATEEETEVGVPILSKVPILNRLFTNRAKFRDATTILILVKATILIQDELEDEYEPRD